MNMYSRRSSENLKWEGMIVKRKIGLVLSVILTVSLFGGTMAGAKNNAPAPHKKTYSVFDVNKDGIVDTKDLKMVNTAITKRKYDSRCDVNGDRVVNSKDYILVKNNLTKSIKPTPAPTATPVSLEYDFNIDKVVDNQDLVYFYDIINGINYYEKKYDYYRDGFLDIYDYLYLESNVPQLVSKVKPDCDFNNDGVVDYKDVSEFEIAFTGAIYVKEYDLDNDGSLDNYDYFLLRSQLPPVIVTPKPTPPDKKYDFNNDGVVDSTDAEVILEVMSSAKYDPIYDLDNDGRVYKLDCYILEKMINDANPDTPSYDKYDLDRNRIVDKYDLNSLLWAMKRGVYEPSYDLNADMRIDSKDYGILANAIPTATPSPSVEPTSALVPLGPEFDFNGDGKVNVDDLVILGEAVWGSGEYKAIYDVNKDGKVDDMDYAFMKHNLVLEISTPVPSKIPVDYRFDLNSDNVIDSKDLDFLSYIMKYQTICDLNRDGYLNKEDYNILMKQLASSQVPSPNPTPTPVLEPLGPEFDFNKDGIVDNKDLEIVYKTLIAEDYDSNNKLFDFNRDGKFDKRDYYLMSDGLQNMSNKV